MILTPSSHDGNNKQYSYKDRTQEVQAHSDALTLLGPRPIIAGLSFGGK